MSVLKFKNYIVKEISYQKNLKFNKANKQITLKPSFYENDKIADGLILVDLKVSVGSLENTRMPFEAVVALQGKFEYVPEDDEDNFGLTTFIKQNAVAILYPYVRTMISNLTMASNEYPGFLLPTINVSEELKKQR